MQNEQTLEQMIREYEANMPPEIMNIIKSFDYRKEVRTIVNQNQLLIDTGADLEQSIYLMILGAIKVEDLYERLLDTHELPEDKVRKIIQEVELLIFNPLHKKLMDSDKEASQSLQNSGGKDIADRDSILAEIEKEPEPIVVKFDPSKINQSPQRIEDETGIVKPFSINLTNEVQVEKPKIEAPAPVVSPTPITQFTPVPPMTTVAPVEGVQEDPIFAGLTQSTVSQAKVASKPSSIDPYREPIE